MAETEKQSNNSIGGDTLNLKPWLWKKGQSGNPLGRPKGKTLKEWCRDYLSRLPDEEREEFLDGIPKEIVWKMAEGNPKEQLEHSGEVGIKTIEDGIKKIAGE